VLGLLCGFLVAICLGALYATLIVHVPFVYVRVGLAIGYGVLIGFVTTRVMRAFHVRSTAIVFASVFGLAVMGWLVSWIAWLPQVFTDVRLIHMLDPLVVLDAVLQIYDEGSWGMGRRATFHMVNGPQLGLIWCTEAAIIIGFPLLAALMGTSEQVYCEDCNAWCQVVPEAKRLDESAFDTLKSGLFEGGDLSALNQLPAPFSQSQWLRLRVAYCDHCHGTNAIAVDTVKMRQTQNGEIPEITPRIAYHCISSSQIRTLRKRLSF
jgi:hypothetical protein